MSEFHGNADCVAPVKSIKDTSRSKTTRDYPVWVLDETGYHAIPRSEYEARMMYDPSEEGKHSCTSKKSEQHLTGERQTKSQDKSIENNHAEGSAKIHNENFATSHNESPCNSSDTDSVPIELYTVSEIQKILRIGANVAYNLVHSKQFPVVRIGNQIRIPKDEFIKWIKSSPTVSF